MPLAIMAWRALLRLFDRQRTSGHGVDLLGSNDDHPVVLGALAPGYGQEALIRTKPIIARLTIIPVADV